MEVQDSENLPFTQARRFIRSKSNCIASSNVGIPYYLDILDSKVTDSGKELTEHIKKNLNDCTDIIVVISEATRYSQWVPFEVGMSAQKDMPNGNVLEK